MTLDSKTGIKWTSLWKPLSNISLTTDNFINAWCWFKFCFSQCSVKCTKYRVNLDRVLTALDCISILQYCSANEITTYCIFISGSSGWFTIGNKCKLLLIHNTSPFPLGTMQQLYVRTGQLISAEGRVSSLGEYNPQCPLQWHYMSITTSLIIGDSNVSPSLVRKTFLNHDDITWLVMYFE